MEVCADKSADTGDAPVRNSNLEALRIISIALIVFHHLVVHSEVSLPDEFGFNTLIYMIGVGMGKVGVAGFVLITGYFMVTKTLTIKRLMTLMTKIWFFSIAITLFLVFCLEEEFTVELAITTFFSLVTARWWFITAYVILLILSPFINKCLNNLDSKQHLLLCGILIMLTMGLTAIDEQFYMTEYAAFITMYVIAGFVRLHPLGMFADLRRSAALLLVGIMAYSIIIAISVINYNGGMDPSIPLSYVSMIIVAVVLILISILMKRKVLEAFLIIIPALILISTGLHLLEMDRSGIMMLVDMRSISSMLLAFPLFLVFLNMKPRYSKPINWFAGSMLAVYLLHEELYICEYLSKVWLHTADYFDSELYLPYLLGAVVLVILVCVVIDKVREYLIFRPLSRYIDGFCDWADAQGRRIWSRLDEQL